MNHIFTLRKVKQEKLRTKALCKVELSINQGVTPFISIRAFNIHISLHMQCAMSITMLCLT